MENRKFGLRPQKRDRRDLSLHKHREIRKLGAFNLDALPPDGLGRPKAVSRNQGTTNECTGYTLTGMRGFKFQKEFTPDWVAAQESYLEGVPGGSYHSLRTQAKVATTKGVLPSAPSYPSWQENGEVFATTPSNWPDSLLSLASPYKAGGFFSVVKGGSLDVYDSIRVALATHDVDGEGVSAGMMWYGSYWNGVDRTGILPPPNTNESWSGHNIRIYDWNRNGLIADAHFGPDWGDGGVCYISRVLANQFIFASEGPYIYLDGIELDQVKAEQWGLLEMLKDALMKLLEILHLR